MFSFSAIFAAKFHRKMTFKRKTGLFLAFLLLPAFMFLMHNQVANWHYHLLPSGIPVKHAHPYNKSELPIKPFASHGHTDLELLVYGQLSQTFTTTLILLLVGIFVVVCRRKTQLSGLGLFPEIFSIFHPGLRAPPPLL
jgi:hypothetical protein